MMNEFASSWDEGVITEFSRFDKNGDGTITTLEALAAVKQGILRGAVSSGGPASSSSLPSGTTSASATSAAAPIDRSDLPADADEKWVKFVASRIAKSDKDKNGRLTIDEWSPSDGDFKSIDANADGSVSLGEYYDFRKNKK
jgi:Ca2+-binding EF-hand superfamily protein